MARVLPQGRHWLAGRGDLELGLRWELGAPIVEIMSWTTGCDKCRVPLVLAPCDAAGDVAKWELQGNGQVKMAQTDMCVSQLGPSAAVVNAASAASVSASSTLDPSHGAALAIDGVATTYWVSKLDDADSVSFLLDLGEPVHGSTLELDFEFVPSAFAVEASWAESEDWLQVFATDSNTLKHVKIPLRAAKPISAIRLIMKKAILCLARWVASSLSASVPLSC